MLSKDEKKISMYAHVGYLWQHSNDGKGGGCRVDVFTIMMPAIIVKTPYGEHIIGYPLQFWLLPTNHPLALHQLAIAYIHAVPLSLHRQIKFCNMRQWLFPSTVRCEQAILLVSKAGEERASCLVMTLVDLYRAFLCCLKMKRKYACVHM